MFMEKEFLLVQELDLPTNQMTHLTLIPIYKIWSSTQLLMIASIIQNLLDAIKTDNVHSVVLLVL